MARDVTPRCSDAIRADLPDRTGAKASRVVPGLVGNVAVRRRTDAGHERGERVAKVQMQHPEGRKAPSIEESMYDTVRTAILAALPRSGPGVAFRDLSQEVAA